MRILLRTGAHHAMIFQKGPACFLKVLLEQLNGSTGQPHAIVFGT
jgi:hypothetical protein